MPGRFSPTGPSEIRYNLLQPEDYEPRLYIGGSPETGFPPPPGPPPAPPPTAADRAKRDGHRSIREHFIPSNLEHGVEIHDRHITRFIPIVTLLDSFLDRLLMRFVPRDDQHH